MSRDPDTLNKAVDCAYRQDELFKRGLNKRRAIEEGPNKRPKLTDKIAPSSGDHKQDVCAHCQKSHPGKKSYKITGACLKCGVVGHFIRDCPRRIADDERRRVKAKTFALTKQDAETSPNVVTGDLQLGVKSTSSEGRSAVCQTLAICHPNRRFGRPNRRFGELTRVSTNTFSFAFVRLLRVRYKANETLVPVDGSDWCTVMCQHLQQGERRME